MKISLKECTAEMMQQIIDSIKMAQTAHYVDLVFRVNGLDQRVEADWVKYLRVSSKRGTHER